MMTVINPFLHFSQPQTGTSSPLAYYIYFMGALNLVVNLCIV